MRLSLRLALMLALPPLLWAGNAVLGRLLVGSMGPLWINAWRWVVALALLLPFGYRVLAGPAARREIAGRWRHLAVLGLFGIGTYNALQYMALHTSTPLNVTLIASSVPVWTVLIGAIGYGVKPRRAQLAGAALSLAGVVLVLSRGDAKSLLHIEFVEGDLLILLAILGWSFYSWMLVRPPAHMRGTARPAWNWAEFLLAQCLFGVVWAVGGATVGELIAPSAPVRWSWLLVGSILYMAVGPSILAYRVWGVAVTEAGPTLAAVFYNLNPVFAAILSALVIGELPQPYHGIAFALIVSGIAVASKDAGKPG